MEESDNETISLEESVETADSRGRVYTRKRRKHSDEESLADSEQSYDEDEVALQQALALSLANTLAEAGKTKGQNAIYTQLTLTSVLLHLWISPTKPTNFYHKIDKTCRVSEAMTITLILWGLEEKFEERRQRR